MIYRTVVVELDSGEIGFIVQESVHFVRVRTDTGPIARDIIVSPDEYTVICEYTIGYENDEMSGMPATEGES